MKIEIAARILFEDNHIIAINKLPSEIIQGDKTGDRTLGDEVKVYLKEKYNKPGDVYLGVVHRIDRPVSGAVLFAKTSKALSRLNEMFRTKEVQKTYWAVVKSRPEPPQGHLVHYLVKNEATNKSRAYPVAQGKALLSELDYKVLNQSDNYTLLEILPHTGRHHQIRVQLSTMGWPIKGDLKYGFNRSNPDGSIHLHARKVAFTHPVKGDAITITANPPEEPIWNYFLSKSS